MRRRLVGLAWIVALGLFYHWLFGWLGISTEMVAAVAFATATWARVEAEKGTK